MKFTDGYWHLRKGVTMLRPAEAFDAVAAGRAANDLRPGATHWAPERHAEQRPADGRTVVAPAGRDRRAPDAFRRRAGARTKIRAG